MRSPYWQCPHCHKLARKDAQVAELAELAGLVTGTGKCPNCDRPIELEALYVKAKYDIPMADVYHGKYGSHLVENIRQLYEAGQVTLSEEEKNLLLKSGEKPTGGQPSEVEIASKERKPKRLSPSQISGLTFFAVILCAIFLGAIMLLFGPLLPPFLPWGDILNAVNTYACPVAIGVSVLAYFWAKNK